MNTPKKTRLSGIASLVAIVALLGGCDIFGGGIIECDEDLGVCPRPEVGLLVDDGRFAKSVWAEAGEMVRPVFQTTGEVQVTLCLSDVDRAPGDEVILKGESGFVVFVGAPTAPDTLVEVSIANMLGFTRRTLFVDADADGNAEYLRFSESRNSPFARTLTLMAHDGSRRWRRQVDLGGPFLGDWDAADIDADGTLEFAVTTAQGVDLVRADGSLLRTIGTRFYRAIGFADIDGDGEFELITEDRDTVTTWASDGRRLASFENDAYRWWGGIVRIDGETPIDRIRIGCLLFDQDRNEVGTAERGEFGQCASDDFNPLDAFNLDGCPEVEDTHTVERTVRFEKDRDPYRVELSYSYRTQIPFIAGLFSSQPTRCIIRIFDPDGSFVYHEVIASRSAPESAVVIPSDVEGEEILLVADDTRILAYQLGG